MKYHKLLKKKIMMMIITLMMTIIIIIKQSKINVGKTRITQERIKKIKNP